MSDEGYKRGVWREPPTTPVGLARLVAASSMALGALEAQGDAVKDTRAWLKKEVENVLFYWTKLEQDCKRDSQAQDITEGDKK